MSESPRQVGRSPGPWWSLLVCGLTLLILSLLAPRFMAELDPPTGDEPFYLQMAQSLLYDRDFEMSNNYARKDYLDFYPKDTVSPQYGGWQSFPWDLPPHQSRTLRPGLYEKHGIGLPILIAPAYWAQGRPGTVYFMVFLAALLAANVFLLAYEYTGSLRASLLAWLGLAFTSPLLSYAFLIFPAIPAALLAVYVFRRARLSPGNNSLQLAGVGLSLAFLPWLHAGYLLLSLPLFVYFLARSWGNQRLLGIFLAPIVLSGALFLYYYYYLYGTIVPNYQDHAGFSFPWGTLQGVWGLLLDQQWGLLTYAPFYLVALAGILLMARRQRHEVPWMLVATVPTLLFFASYRQWWGEWCPPARYLVPILPLWAGPAALVLRDAHGKGKFLAGVLLAASLAVAGSFVVAPKLMYNHPTGQSQLLLAWGQRWGLDATGVLPSFVAPGEGILWQGALWGGLAALAVAALVAWARPRRTRAARWVRDKGPQPRRRRGWGKRLLSGPGLAFLLGLILLLGAYFRLVGVDWDSGQHLQPDERFITMVATDIRLPDSIAQYFDSASSPLNPYNRNHPNYPYGTSFLFVTKFLSAWTGMEGYDRIYLLGRLLSVLFDLGSVALLFFMGKRLYGPLVGLLGAFLYSASVLPIQYSHFFVAESPTIFFVLLTLHFAVRVSQGSGWASFLSMGVACGLALASKVSVAFLIPLMAVGSAISLRGEGRCSLARSTLGLGLALVTALLAFRVAQPYAFAGSSFLDLRPSLRFLGDIEAQRRMAEGSLEFPYTLQWAGTIPYLYPLQNLLWGLGPALAVAALVGAGLALYQLWRERRLEHLLLLLWVGLVFIYFGGQMVKFMRYLLPIYPFLALLAAFSLVTLGRAARERWKRRGLASSLAALAMAVVLGGTLLWALAFTRIYAAPHTRVEASRWIYQNVPAGTVVANEHWDDPLPLRVDGQDPGRYRSLSLELYNDDNEAKRQTLLQQLGQADYIFISSNRLYASIPRLPLRYPMTREYYRLLFSGELGFERIRSFTSYPNLWGLETRDDEAEEAFTVYDHPKVIIFKKGVSFSQERAQRLLSAVSLEGVIRQGPRDAARNALVMTPELRRANQEGGTWSQVFDPRGWPSRFPALAWYLLVQALSLAVLPLGLVALRGLPDRGYPLLKALGILLVAYLSWLAASLPGWGTSLRLAPYSRPTILGAVALLAVLSAAVFWRWRREIGRALREGWRVVLATEALFLVAFIAFYLIRLANPDLWHAWRGGEKPMDLAYLNAVVKSTYFPPYDPWFSGGYINYYYFGQVIVGTLIKLTGIPTAISYNLAVPILFALTVLGAFSAGYNLVAMRSNGRRAFLWAFLGGLAAALLVAVAGNLDGLIQKVQALWQLNPVPWASPWPGAAGLVNAWLGVQEVLAGKILLPFDYWRSSRLMSPSISITEFPYFTFLFADLHPHLIALPFSLLALGFILNLGQKSASWSQALLTPLSLGALWVINSWDFPTYFLLAAGVLFFVRYGGWGWATLGRWVLATAGLFVASYLLYYPFHHYYQQFYLGVSPSPERTPLPQYLGVHGLFVFILASYLLARLWRNLKGLGHRRSMAATQGPPPGHETMVQDTPHFSVGYGTPPHAKAWGIGRGNLAPFFVAVMALLAVAVGAVMAALIAYQLYLVAFLYLLLVLALADLALAWRHGQGHPARVAAILIAAALLLGIGVEFLTIQGDIQRMNTVFKFYLQAWILMGVAAAYCLISLVRGWAGRPRRWLAFPWLLALGVGLWATLLYPLSATPVRVLDRFAPLPPTDDGMAYMRVARYTDDRGKMDLLWDYRGIRWMQENIRGSPVVLEGVTPLYRWGSRVSIYTGLPTVIGWDWHQKQQRAAYHDQVEQRLADVRTMYSTADTPTLLRLLQRYGIGYIYVGELERNYYPASGLDKLEALEGSALRRVYQEGPLTIYQVVRQ